MLLKLRLIVALLVALFLVLWLCLFLRMDTTTTSMGAVFVAPKVHSPAAVAETRPPGEKPEGDHWLEAVWYCRARQAALHASGKWTLRNKHLDHRDGSIVMHEKAEDEGVAAAKASLVWPTEPCHHSVGFLMARDRKCPFPSGGINQPIYVDSHGKVCSQDALDTQTGCCVTRLPAHSCLGCNPSLQCCKIYPYCVSCCMALAKTAPETALILLEECSHRCRTSSHTQRPPFVYCYGGAHTALPIGAQPNYPSNDDIQNRPQDTADDMGGNVAEATSDPIGNAPSEIEWLN